ncbi:MAG: PEGA domain-containing protein [Candidatus Omnitrophota bacterium]
MIYAQGQKIRALLFYCGLLIFIISLPLVLSYALGYKFDSRRLRFVRVGLISLKTEPEGAEVYFRGRLLNGTTPLSINELLPGKYPVEVHLKDYYPWKAEVTVEAGRVSSFERILLFPLKPQIKQLNSGNISSFYVDKEKEGVYYIDEGTHSIYRSDLNGEKYEEYGQIPLINFPIKDYKFSADRKMAAFYSRRQIAVSSGRKDALIFNLQDRELRDIYWFPNNYYLILLTNKSIEYLELRPQAKPVVLVELSKKDSAAFFDPDSACLYFTDQARAEDGRVYEHLYKIDLKEKLKPQTNGKE